MVFALVCFTLISGNTQEAAAKTAAGAYNEGLALLKTKDYENGLALLEEALVIAEADENEKVVGLAKKNGSKAAYNLAKGKYKAKDYAAATTLYKRGMELNPDYASNYSGLANVLKKQNKLDEAIELYIQSGMMNKEAGKTKKVASTLKKLNVIVGKAYTGKEFDKAIEYGTQALTLGDAPSISYYMSRAMIEKGDHAGALESATKAITGAGDKVEDKFYIAQALAYVGLGKKTDAISSYEKVTEEKYLEQAKYQIGKLKG